jgi:23S rRNA maturation-related 3'-5' exoribonuclease YhaM
MHCFVTPNKSNIFQNDLFLDIHHLLFNTVIIDLIRSTGTKNKIIEKRKKYRLAKEKHSKYIALPFPESIDVMQKIADEMEIVACVNLVTILDNMEMKLNELFKNGLQLNDKKIGIII